jgi:hypothetical protein
LENSTKSCEQQLGNVEKMPFCNRLLRPLKSERSQQGHGQIGEGQVGIVSY